MMSPSVLALIGLGLLLKGSDSRPAVEQPDNDGETRRYNPYSKMLPMVARACNMASLGVYKEIAADRKNIVISPFSMCSLLAVCIKGAKGRTLKELKAKLLLKLSNKLDLSKAYASVYKSFMEDEHVNITTSNVLLLNKNHQLVKAAEQDYRDSFNGTVGTFDLEMKGRNMDAMMSSATAGMIGGVLKADDIVSESALYLSNILTLSARWKDEFKIEDTYPMWFYVNDTSKLLTETMNRVGEYRAVKSEDLKCEILEIPYKGSRFAMYILLPFEKDGLTGMEEKLRRRKLKLESILSNMGPAEKRDLYLPKFSISQSFSMTEALKANKIRTLFDDQNADLSALIQGGNVYIKKALQTSIISVMEEGTIAGTETAMVGYPMSAIPEFSANHPFVYILRDTHTDFNIFMGKYSEAEETSMPLY